MKINSNEDNMEDLLSPQASHHGKQTATPWQDGEFANDQVALSSSDHYWEHPTPSRHAAREEQLFKTMAKVKLLLGLDPGPGDVDAAMHLIEAEAPEIRLLLHIIPPESLLALFTAGSHANHREPARSGRWVFHGTGG